MRQPYSPVFPETAHDDERHRRKTRVPATERIAGWSIRHRKTAVFGWLLLVAVIFMVGQAFGSANVTQYDSGQSGHAEHVLEKDAPAQNQPQQEAVLIQARVTGETYATDPAMRQAASQVASALAALHSEAAGIGKVRVSKDGSSALVTFEIPGNVSNTNAAVTADQRAVASVQARYPSLRIAETGDASIGQAVSNGLNFSKAEETSIPITLILLLIVFGAVVAAGIPVLLALTALTAAIGVLTLVSHVLPVSSSTFEVLVVIGMAVGVDYSLFYLRREREERARGRSHDEALRIAARTSGRAILVSGLTVMVTMAGLFLGGVGEFEGMAIATIAVIGIAVAGSLTVLPALLSWLGPKADAGRIPFLGRRRAAARPSRAWGGLARAVVARPLLWGGIAVIAMLALAAPALSMRLGQPGVDAPKSLPTVQTMNAIEQAFPQAPAPAVIVVTGTDVTGPKVAAAVDALRARTSDNGPVRGPVSETAIDGGRALVVDVQLAGDGNVNVHFVSGGTDTTTGQALLALRDQVLPQTLGKVPGVSYAVAGDAAQLYDDVQATNNILPVVFAFVAVLAFVLLLIAFQSLTVPLVSILLNLLSVGAAYGLVTLIFQDGRLQGPLDYTSFGGIIFWVPLFMFVFLFGMSMDYHVFILSRIRELWSHGSSPKDAITGGIASSAGVVTSAAVIMMAVFSIFATLPIVDLKILGVGTAAAILIDVTVVRGILVPAALALLGDRAWGRRRRSPSSATAPGAGGAARSHRRLQRGGCSRTRSRPTTSAPYVNGVRPGQGLPRPGRLAPGS
jgi:putative drug exporter of the RND superfamily